MIQYLHQSAHINSTDYDDEYVQVCHNRCYFYVYVSFGNSKHSRYL